MQRGYKALTCTGFASNTCPNSEGTEKCKIKHQNDSKRPGTGKKVHKVKNQLRDGN